MTKEVVASTSFADNSESTQATMDRWGKILSSDKNFVVEDAATSEERRLVSVTPVGKSLYPPNPTDVVLNKIGRFAIFCEQDTYCQLEPLVASRHCLVQPITGRSGKQKPEATYLHVVAASHWVERDTNTGYWQVERAAGPERMPFAAKVCSNMAPVYEQWREQDSRSLRVLEPQAWLDQVTMDTRSSDLATAMAKYPLLNLWSVHAECPSASNVLLADKSAPLLSGLALPPQVLWTLISKCCGLSNHLEFSRRLLERVFKDLVDENSIAAKEVETAWEQSSMLGVQHGHPTEYRWWKRIYSEALRHAIAGTKPCLESYPVPPLDNPKSLPELVTMMNARPVDTAEVAAGPRPGPGGGGELQTIGAINPIVAQPLGANHNTGQPSALGACHGRKRKQDKWLVEMRRLIKDETITCADRLLQQAGSLSSEDGVEVTYSINVEINGGGASDSYKRVIRRKLQ